MMIATSWRSLSNALEQLLDDGRREALERLVEQQHAHVAGQRAGDRHHLLLAAGEIVGRACRSARARRGKNSKMRSSSQCTPCAGLALEAAELEVVGAPHAGEQPAALRHVADAEPRDLGRGQAARCSLAAERDRAARRRRDADHRLQQRRLAGAVAAEQRHDLVLAHVEATTSCRMWLLP